MSRKGNCYDNAPIESFWGTLKNELIYQKKYATREEAIREITEYISTSEPARHSLNFTVEPTDKPLF